MLTITLIRSRVSCLGVTLLRSAWSGHTHAPRPKESDTCGKTYTCNTDGHAGFYQRLCVCGGKSLDLGTVLPCQLSRDGCFLNLTVAHGGLYFTGSVGAAWCPTSDVLTELRLNFASGGFSGCRVTRVGALSVHYVRKDVRSRLETGNSVEHSVRGQQSADFVHDCILLASRVRQQESTVTYAHFVCQELSCLSFYLAPGALRVSHGVRVGGSAACWGRYSAHLATDSPL